jgi:hypothetical protein
MRITSFNDATAGEPASNDVAAKKSNNTHAVYLKAIKCYNCGVRGHYSNECPNRVNAKPKHDSKNGFTFSQPQGRDISKTWLLLDNQSTVDVFVNPDLLCNLREVPCHLDVHCNAGSRHTNIVGDLPGYGTVWLDEGGISNILSLSRVSQRYHVSYDSEQNNSFLVTKPDGNTFEFKQSDSGLFYLDTSETSTNGVSLVTTVAENKSCYTKADYDKAVNARILQIKIGLPSTKNFIRIV